MAVAFIGLGSNLGDRKGTLLSALDELRALGSQMTVSSMYETDPVGFTDQPAFVNAVVRLDTRLAAVELLYALHSIENAHMRVRTFRNAPRTLDLDLLLYDDIAIETPVLTVPHPRMHERAFVLVPLAEIAAGIRHPLLNRTASEMLGDIGPVEGVVKLPSSTA
ncbi:2-amino-4-hydroxy-6-hydroxymethyldihydropteridinediphosphokinase [soil metagenome]